MSSEASEAAGLLSAVANLFGASPEVVSPEKKAQHGQEEAVEKKEVPKAKALPKQLFVAPAPFPFSLRKALGLGPQVARRWPG